MSGLSFTVKADEAPVLEDPDEMDRSNYLEYISVEDLGAKVTLNLCAFKFTEKIQRISVRT